MAPSAAGGAKAKGPIYPATAQRADRLRKSLGRRFDRTGELSDGASPRWLPAGEGSAHRPLGAVAEGPGVGGPGGLWLPVEVAPSHAVLLAEPDRSLREARHIPRRGHGAAHVVVARSVPTPSLGSPPKFWP